jgi:hypothetical protein
VHADPVRPQHVRDRRDIAEPIGEQPRLGRVHVDVVDGDGVDSDGGQQPRVGPHPGQVAHRAGPPEDRAARVAALHLAHHRVHVDVVPVVEHPPPHRRHVPLHRPVAGERRLAEPHDVEEAVEEAGRRVGHHGRHAIAPGQGEPLAAQRSSLAGEVEDELRVVGEGGSGAGHLRPHRLDQRAGARHPHAARGDRPERRRREPGRMHASEVVDAHGSLPRSDSFRKSTGRTPATRGT